MVAQTSTANIKTSDGAIIHYETHGTPNPSRPSLVFHHYYGGSPATYAAVVSQLHGFHCILFHSRGWSPSTGPEDPDDCLYSIPRLSSDLAAVIDASGAAASSTFVLIGHSMGAKVAQFYAASQLSPRLRGIVLLAPAPLFGLNFPDEAKQQQLAAYATAESVHFILDNILTATNLPPEIKERCVVDSMRGNAAATAAWPNYAAQEDYADLQTKIAVPVLVLRGAQDFEVDILGLTLGAEYGRKNVAVPNCGHLIPLEQPEFLVKQLKIFITEQCS